ncbi:response regulator transcription factor [Guyparkeria sp.]|uniref:response regulator transcription factor n=1 Tax=Guyparkeria sp. TaxID=2035736 RepID=UPI0039707628
MTIETQNDPGLLKILIVDDEPAEIDELREHLEANGIACRGATSSRDAKKVFLEQTDIGVLLVDISMPDEDGMSFIDWATTHYDGDRIFEAAIFSGHRSRDKALDAMRVGARDYFEKPVDPEAVVGAMRDALERVARRREKLLLKREYLPVESLDSSLSDIRSELSELRQFLDSQGDANGFRPVPAADCTELQPQFARLTVRQKEVMKLVANAYSNYQIACELGITENTVKLYVSQILHTLGLSNRTQIALLVNRMQGV